MSFEAAIILQHLINVKTGVAVNGNDTRIYDRMVRGDTNQGGDLRDEF